MERLVVQIFDASSTQLMHVEIYEVQSLPHPADINATLGPLLLEVLGYSIDYQSPVVRTGSAEVDLVLQLGNYGPFVVKGIATGIGTVIGQQLAVRLGGPIVKRFNITEIADDLLLRRAKEFGCRRFPPLRRILKEKQSYRLDYNPDHCEYANQLSVVVPYDNPEKAVVDWIARPAARQEPDPAGVTPPTASTQGPPSGAEADRADVPIPGRSAGRPGRVGRAGETRESGVHETEPGSEALTQQDPATAMITLQQDMKEIKEALRTLVNRG
jgi:hypothetical protein